MIWFWVQKWKYTHASMHACMHECMHACMHPCRCARIPWKTRAELDSPGAPSEWQMAICIYIYICVFKYIYKCIHTCIHMYGYTHVYMYIQKYIHVYLRHQILFTCSPAKHPSREGLRLNDWGLKISKCFALQWIQSSPSRSVCFSNEFKGVPTADMVQSFQMVCVPTNWALWITKCFVFQWLRRCLNSWLDSSGLKMPKGLVLQMSWALWITKCLFSNALNVPQEMTSLKISKRFGLQWIWALWITIVFPQ